MFEDLNGFLEQSFPPSSEFVLIKDCNATCEGTLLIHHFLSLYLQTNSHVCFVGFEEGFEHYSHVARKLGVQLQEHIASGNLKYINGFSQPYSFREEPVHANEAVEFHGRPANSEKAAVSETSDFFSLNNDEEFGASVISLLERIWTCVHAFQEQSESQTCVIIDSLATFLNCARYNAADGGRAAFDFRNSVVTPSEPIPASLTRQPTPR